MAKFVVGLRLTVELGTATVDNVSDVGTAVHKALDAVEPLKKPIAAYLGIDPDKVDIVSMDTLEVA